MSTVHRTGGIEARMWGAMETRVEHDDGSPEVRVGGTFARVNKSTFIHDGQGPLRGFYERISPGAFDEAIRTSKPVLLLNHAGTAMAKAPDTLRIFVAPNGDGGWSATVDTRQSTAADFLVCHSRKVITGTSYSFRLEAGDDEWSADGNTRTIRKISGGIFDISPCQQPADETTITTVEGRTIYYADSLRGGTPRPGRHITHADIGRDLAAIRARKRARLREELEDIRNRQESRAGYTAAERIAMAAAGHAMPGGDYPIGTGARGIADLKRAVDMLRLGTKPTHAAIRRHLARQAIRLGANLIPPSWQADGSVATK